MMKPVKILVYSEFSIFSYALEKYFSNIPFIKNTEIVSSKKKFKESLIKGNFTFVIGIVETKIETLDFLILETLKFRKEIKLILVANFFDPSFDKKIIPQTFQGILPLTTSMEELTTAISIISNGSEYYTVDYLKYRNNMIKEPELLKEKNEPTPILTKRELIVIKLIADGLSNLKIADALDISEFTVRRHVQNIHSKLKTNSKPAIVKLAYEKLLI